VDDESVGLGQERDGAGCLVLAGIPDDGLSLLPSLVHGDGVEGVVGGAGGQDVDGARGGGEGGVVPGKGDLVLDLVVAGGRHGIGGDHGGAARGQAGIEFFGLVGGVGGLAAAAGGLAVGG